MKEISYKDENGKTMNISIIGCFRIPELEKEFVMYSFMDDDSSNDEGLVLLGEIIRNNDDVQIVGINEEEQEMVVAYYNEIVEQVGGSEDE